MGWFSRPSPTSDASSTVPASDEQSRALPPVTAPAKETIQPLVPTELPSQKGLPPKPSVERRDLPFVEPRKQLVTFLAGASFLVASTLITKRSVTRRWKASMPKFYQPNTDPNKVKGMVEAVEALQLATLNVMGGAIMATGGILWALRIRDMDDLKTTYRVYREGEEAAVERFAGGEASGAVEAKAEGLKHSIQAHNAVDNLAIAVCIALDSWSFTLASFRQVGFGVSRLGCLLEAGSRHR